MFVCRSYKESDYEDVCEFHLMSMRERNCMLNSSDLASDLKDISRSYLSTKGAFMIATYMDRPIGMVALFYLDDLAAELRHLYVQRSNRGMKVGNILLNSVLKFADESGFNLVHAYTAESMHAAQGLLKKQGFKLTSRVKQDGQEYVILSRKQMD